MFSPATALKLPPFTLFDSLPSAYYFLSSAAACTPLCSCCSCQKMPPMLRSATASQGENFLGPGRSPERYVTPSTDTTTTPAGAQPLHHPMTPAALPQMDVTMADDLEGELIYSAPPTPNPSPASTPAMPATPAMPTTPAVPATPQNPLARLRANPLLALVPHKAHPAYPLAFSTALQAPRPLLLVKKILIISLIPSPQLLLGHKQTS